MSTAEAPIKVVAALPSYDGTRWNANALACLYRSNVDTLEVQGSLLTSTFNRCWVEALNMREQGKITHFLMLHADVVPHDFDWARALWEEFAKHQCKVLSVAIPIKSDVGITSTGWETDDLWRPRRLTVQELLDRPVTWTHGRLLVNTGMMLVDFREAWVEKVCFTVRDRIHKPNGKWVCEVESEDWNFSRQLRALGIAPWVTRRVGVTHMGIAGWRNDLRWGSAIDPNVSEPLSEEL
jgi:hypothetical protein